MRLNNEKHPSKKPGQKIGKSLSQTRYTDGKLAHEKMFSIFSHQRNTNQNRDERVAHPLQRLQTTSSAGEDTEQLQVSEVTGGAAMWCIYFGKQLTRFF